MKRILCVAIVLSLLLVYGDSAAAQVTGPEWSQPVKLSSLDGVPTGGANLMVDERGFVHAFWAEQLVDERQHMIQHAIFDGREWSEPVDIFVSSAGSEVRGLSARQLADDRILISWMNGVNSPIHMMEIPAEKARLRSARYWSDIRSVTAEAYGAQLRVTDDGIFHLVYTTYFGYEPGVYYTQSDDDGWTWTTPVQLDRLPEATYRPQSVSLKIDDDGGFHVIWWYSDVSDGSVRGSQIDYVHSLDGGESWSVPFTIDEESEDLRHQVRSAAPKLAVTGSNVEVVWAAGDLPYRHRRLSTDRGRTWGDRERLAIFGTLHGQAGDALIDDEKGRLHYFTQIRYPMGVYHVIGENNTWGYPSMFYNIGASEGPELVGIHVHGISAAIAAGDKLVITFTNSPGESERVLYTMQRTLGDLPAIAAQEMALPTPVPVDSRVALTQSVATGQRVEEVSALDTLPEVASLGFDRSPDAQRSLGRMFYLVGAVLPMLVVAGYFGRRMLRKR